MTQKIKTEAALSLQKASSEIYLFRGIIPIKAYEVLTKHQQEITPLLIQILKDVIQRHDRTGDYYVAHIHALFLLSQFREKKTYPIVIALLNLPIKSIDRLLGDLLTEKIHKILANVYDGNPEPLFDLLLNHEADFVLRLVVGECLSTLIYQKMIDQQQVILRLQESVASGKMNEDRGFFTVLADITIECKFESLYDTVRAAFKAGMVFEDYVNIHDFERNILLPIDQLVQEDFFNPIVDAAQELAKWYSNEKQIIPQIERNAPCPCGSGHKFKKCCICHL